MIRIIPAIDLIGGCCVRLTKGDYGRQTTYSSDPYEVARAFEDAGIRRLHLVDLDGARSSGPANLAVLEKIVSGTSLEVEFGGGIKNAEALSSVFSAGATWAICGSIAVTAPEELHDWCSRFGAGRFILGADLDKGFVATHGWQKTSRLPVSGLLSSFPEISQCICTDISRDGMLQGLDFEFYTALQEDFPSCDVILSGGVSCVEDILEAERRNLRGIIIGKAFYEGRISLSQIAALCSQNE